MKYYAKRTYEDVKLKRDVETNEELHEAYKKDGVELTEERINYLVNERNLYNAVEEIPEDKVIDIEPVDEVLKGENIIDRIDIVEDSNEELEEETPEEKEIEDEEEKTKTTDEENNKEAEAKESEEENTEEKEIKNKTTGRGKKNK